MKPRLEQHFREYRAYHRNEVNLAIHKVAVPAILLHVVIMCDWVELHGRTLTLGHVVIALAAVWYARASLRYAAIVIPFAVAGLWLGRFLAPWVVVAIAVVAWTAQLVGHARFERRAPAFRDNLVQLLVGPAYIVALWLGDWPPPSET